MESHAIPQQISSYQFRLVGYDLKTIFPNCGWGFNFNYYLFTSIIGIIKWPFVILFALLESLAFLPLEERPLERWIIAFLNLFIPQQYFPGNRKEFNYYQDEANVPSEKFSTPGSKTAGIS